ncbi:uncharacterized protein [Drosophila virilis]|uniref:Uncharacterized protein n=1 Tax=Drosophila virilis TaxID=7244 RepID=B4M7C4_DROVI|nr:uncharacterized protein LOC6633395 [Drosophila virilis]EDW62691.1 uncharacterized protein Dvir_GJ16482 [Drosophila virilis]
MEANTLNRANPTGSSSDSSSSNWCCIMDKLPKAAVAIGDGPAPTQPTKLFEWLCAKNLPQLEDETPPIGFYEVLEHAEIAFHCTRCDKLMISLDAQLLQRSIGTQTQIRAQLQAETQTLRSQLAQGQHAQTQTQTQTHKQIQGQADSETQTQTQTQKQTQTQTQAPNQETLLLPVQLVGSASVPQQRSLLDAFQDVWQLRLRGRSLWSLLKTLLVLISLLHGCYVLGGSLQRLPVLRRLILTAQAICQPAPPPPPQPRTLPAFIWSQLCRLARKLHIV